MISSPKKFVVVSKEKLFPLIEEKPSIDPSKIVEEKDRPKTVSLEEHVALQLGEQIGEEYNISSYLIKEKDDEEFNFLGTPIRDLPKYRKEQIDQILSTCFPQPSNSEEAKPKIQVFN